MHGVETSLPRGSARLLLPDRISRLVHSTRNSSLWTCARPFLMLFTLWTISKIWEERRRFVLTIWHAEWYEHGELFALVKELLGQILIIFSLCVVDWVCQCRYLLLPLHARPQDCRFDFKRAVQGIHRGV